MYDRLRCENNLSLIVLFGTWLSCLKLKFETKGFVKNIEIDGGAVMNSLMVTYMWAQMGYLRVYVGFVANTYMKQNS